jgi:DNA-binding CsgD family transcriptional regulator
MSYAALIETLIEQGERASARVELTRAQAEGWRDGTLQLNLPGHARRVGAPRALGIALRASGLIEAAHGGLESLETLNEAETVLAGSGARLERARTLVEIGAVLRRAGRRRNARERLQQGHDLAHICGATALAQRARQELRAVGVRVRRHALSGAESLTPSERRVAELIAGGLSNREAAQSLFVTEKTIETHLSHVYRKLGIHSRAQLPQAMVA